MGAISSGHILGAAADIRPGPDPEEWVVITNHGSRPCKSCGKAHPYLTATNQATCGIPIAVRADDERYLRVLRKFGEPKPVPEGMHTVPFPPEPDPDDPR